ncbi:MAG: DUF4276 family protein [Candidatus Omnitrophota bacterium]
MNNTAIHVYIIVEGRTEQAFIRKVLAPYMGEKGIFFYPELIGNSGHKGGNVRFDRALKDIGVFLKQRKDTFVSTMFDYFQIDKNWPGRGKIKGGISLIAGQKAEFLETAMAEKVIEEFPIYNPKNRFIPYIQMHEFEALLFSNASVLSDAIDVSQKQIEEIINRYNDPEEINDGPKTAPSKRLKALNRRYIKTSYGELISFAIGIDNIRSKCPHFNHWLTTFEKIIR